MGHGHDIPYYAVGPFVLILMGIAILPLVRHHWWEENKNKALFAALIGIPTTGYLLWLDWHMLIHAGEEYISFIALLGSLYIVSGGVVLRGDLKPGPVTNASILTIGSILASIIGTTGASMLLIRPFLRANAVRSNTKHIPIFFIFCVSNAGGLLTPLGDPPLFLGFLRGVPFTWTLSLWPQWLTVNALIIAIFFVVDYRLFRSGGTPPEIERKPMGLGGGHNLFLLGLIIVCVAVKPYAQTWPLLKGWWSEVGMAIAAILSLVTTKKPLREENGFTYHPINEVAILFAAIFVTMQPALGLLAVYGPKMGLNTPTAFYWVTGILSSFLDNAPTYVTFFTVAKSLGGDPATLVAATGVAAPFLAAISLGAVFMGANTYIGNGPNFMVKSICDEAGFKTPSFFGYMIWSFGILGPIWILVGFVFL